MVTKACIKKEFLEEVRSKRLLTFVCAVFGIAIFSVFIALMLDMISKYLPKDEELGIFESMFTLNYGTMFMYFASFMVSYFALLVVFMNMRVVSKEIKDKKWVSPITSGISPSHMIGAKQIVKNLTIVLTVIAGCVLHFILTVIISKPTVVEGVTVFGINKLIVGYVCIILNILLFSVLTLSLNAISKKIWPAITFPLIILMVLSTILEAIEIKGQAIINFTPLVFYEYVMTSMNGVATNITTAQWIVGSLTFVALVAGMIVWSLFANKVKVQKDVK